MDFAAETIQKVLDITSPKILDIKDAKGRTAPFALTTRGTIEVQAAPPATAPMVEVTTLAGLADLVRAKLDAADFPADYLLHVEDETTVALIQRTADDYGRRITLVKATPVPFEQFRFGQFLDQENFAIGLASKFAESDDKAYVLNLASSLTNEATSNLEDNGFTQKATVRAGLAHKQVAVIKPVVALAPYRTFPEVAQPVSQFVFRARTEGSSPNLMLVEADGGRWKVDAIATLRQAMEAFGLEIPIIA
jgi:hypothetical protein